MSQCSVSDCDKEVHSKGMCYNHYHQDLRARKRLAKETTIKIVNSPEISDEELIAAATKPLDKHEKIQYKGLNSLQRFVTYHKFITGLHLVDKIIIWDMYNKYPFEDKIADKRSFFIELKHYLEVTKEYVRLTVDPFIEGLKDGTYAMLGNSIVYAEVREERKAKKQKKLQQQKEVNKDLEKEIEEIFGD